MPPPRLIGCILGIAAMAIAGPMRAETLEAGVVRVDITPPLGFLMDGYPDPDSLRAAVGVRDPLYARILVLECGATRLALVDLDLVDVFTPPYIEELRRAMSRDVSDLIVEAIHTHSGPVLDGGPATPQAAWYKAAVEKIAAGVHEASSHCVPVKLGVGYGVAFLGHNRLRIEHDLGISWFEKNWTGTPNGAVDPTVAVLRIDDVAGNPLAVLVNYACHPVIYAPDNKLYSADFPGVMTGFVQNAMGGKPLCFYMQGGAGNINPTHAVSPLQQGAVEFCRQAGTELGSVVVRVAQGILTEAPRAPSLLVKEETITLHPRWNAAKWQATHPENAAFIARLTEPVYQAPLCTVLIDREIALTALPGEPFIEHQMQFRARCPVPHAFFLGYSNAEFDYFPTIRAASWGGYGASHASTWVEVGAGEAMVDRGLIGIYEMLGRLKSTPEDLQP